MSTVTPDMPSQDAPVYQHSGPSIPVDLSPGPDRRVIITTLVLLIAIGLAFRVVNLGAIGFAEDEVNKVDAVRAYERGDISANGEHPMLMKALMFASVKAARMFDGPGVAVSDARAGVPTRLLRVTPCTQMRWLPTRLVTISRTTSFTTTACARRSSLCARRRLKAQSSRMKLQPPRVFTLNDLAVPI